MAEHQPQHLDSRNDHNQGTTIPPTLKGAIFYSFDDFAGNFPHLFLYEIAQARANNDLAKFDFWLANPTAFEVVIRENPRNGASGTLPRNLKISTGRKAAASQLQGGTTRLVRKVLTVHELTSNQTQRQPWEQREVAILISEMFSKWDGYGESSFV
jgi:hypothetical protein